MFRKRGREGEREPSMCGCSWHAPYWDLARNPGMCPDWESNQWPFGSQACAQSTELHQPGPYVCVCVCVCVYFKAKPLSFWEPN